MASLRTILSAGMVVGGLMAGGCWVPGYYPEGSQATRGLFTYPSNPDYPQTIALRDLTSGEVIWSVDVPVGKQLVVRFFDDWEPRNTSRPALMRWEIMDLGRAFGELDNVIPAPHELNRRLDVTYRKSREGVPTPTNLPPPEPAAK